MQCNIRSRDLSDPVPCIIPMATLRENFMDRQKFDPVIKAIRECPS